MYCIYIFIDETGEWNIHIRGILIQIGLSNIFN